LGGKFVLGKAQGGGVFKELLGLFLIKGPFILGGNIWVLTRIGGLRGNFKGRFFNLTFF